MFQRRGVAFGNNVAWKRDEQGWRMQRSARQFRIEVVRGAGCQVLGFRTLASIPWRLAP